MFSYKKYSQELDLMSKNLQEDIHIEDKMLVSYHFKLEYVEDEHRIMFNLDMSASQSVFMYQELCRVLRADKLTLCTGYIIYNDDMIDEQYIADRNVGYQLTDEGNKLFCPGCKEGGECNH